MCAQFEQGWPILRDAGECGLIVEFGSGWSEPGNRAVMAFAAELDAATPAGVIEIVPTIRSLLVRYDPLDIAPANLKAEVKVRLAAHDWAKAPRPAARHFRLPVVYGGAAGPDLGAVADLMGWREDQVIAGHAGQALSVAMLGFAPGCAYLAGLSREWDLPRRSELAAEVPAGAILVALRQTVLPATPMPTGWQQIGTTPVRSFDLAHRPPFLLAPGDEVVFEPVSAAEARKFDPLPLWRKVAK